MAEKWRKILLTLLTWLALASLANQAPSHLLCINAAIYLVMPLLVWLWVEHRVVIPVMGVKYLLHRVIFMNFSKSRSVEVCAVHFTLRSSCSRSSVLMAGSLFIDQHLVFSS